NGRLAGLSVADDQFSLSAADRDHCVNGLDARLQGLAYRLTCVDPGRHALNTGRARRVDRAFPIDRLADRVHHATDQGIADWNLCNTSRAFYRIAFLDAGIVPPQHAR